MRNWLAQAFNSILLVSRRPQDGGPTIQSPAAGNRCTHWDLAEIVSIATQSPARSRSPSAKLRRFSGRQQEGSSMLMVSNTRPPVLVAGMAAAEC
jgi:hypothetical protein